MQYYLKGYQALSTKKESNLSLICMETCLFNQTLYNIYSTMHIISIYIYIYLLVHENIIIPF